MRAKLTLFVVPLAIAALLGEALVRMTDPSLLQEDDRVILTSAGFVEDESGAIRYPPHQSVRSAVLSREGIEFDVRYRTNNLGLVDHRDYPSGSASETAWAFVGDSFAAGVEGGTPWIPALRDELDLEIYNLGIGATGIQHFSRILSSGAKRLAFDDVVIVAISDDFFRPGWFPLNEGDEFRLCIEGEDMAACRERRPIAYRIDPSLSLAEILARGEEVRHRASSARQMGSRVRQHLRKSRLLLLMKRFVEANLVRRLRRSAELDENLAALESIRRNFSKSRIRFVHVPDRSEASRDQYAFDPKDQIEERGIEYFDALAGCAWPPEHYHRRDQHLNAEGYQALANCVAEYLGLSAPR